MADDPKNDEPLYRQVLGTAFDTLPAPLQKLHTVTATHVWTGQADITASACWHGRLMARIIGFPTKSRKSPVKVTLNKQQSGELWQRDFDGHRFQSHQSAGKGRDRGMIIEQFGSIRVALTIQVEDDRLNLIPRRWRIFGIPGPAFLLPKGESFEHAPDGRFNFDVTVILPLIGHIVTYRGWLEPDDTQSP